VHHINRIAYYMCQCSCGTQKIISIASLLQDTQSCGCLLSEKSKARAATKNRPVIGHKFGKLTVLRVFVENKKCRAECECECGNTITVVSSQLTKGIKVNCGCEKRRSNTKLYGLDSFVARLTKTYRSNAVSRGLVYSLGYEIFLQRITSSCVYCGRPPDKEKELSGETIKYLGIDRINNELGYTEANTASCCERCNRMKLSLSIDDFRDHINLIFNHLNYTKGDGDANSP